MFIPSENIIKKIKSYKKLPIENFTFQFLTDEETNIAAFLYSQKIFKLPHTRRRQLLQELKHWSKPVQYKICFEYLIDAFDQRMQFETKVKTLMKKASVENLITYLEFSLNKIIKDKTDINGVRYSDEIISSKHDFLISILPTLLNVSRENNLPLSTNKLLPNSPNSKLLLLMLAQQHSLNLQILEVLKGSYIPMPINFLNQKYGDEASKPYEKYCKYFLQRVPENLDTLEIYRDLNYSLAYQEQRELSEAQNTMREAGVIKKEISNQLIHFDFTKEQQYNEILEIKKAGEFVKRAYGSLLCVVKYKNFEFTIQDLITLIKKINSFVNTLYRTRIKQKKQLNLVKRSIKDLSKQFHLTAIESVLLELLAHDVNSRNVNNSLNLPFLKGGGMFYIFLPGALELNYEKVIDKVLSQKEVIVTMSNEHKGELFEVQLQNTFKKAGFEIGKINRDQKKNIPEIDCLVDFDENTVLVIEAKCTIKPEQRNEVFSFAENHLNKATNQLIERVSFLKSRPSLANERLSFDVRGKKFIPLIITNHSFFSGFKVTTEEGLLIHCIDELLLKKIVIEGYLPEWEYTGIDNNYVFRDKKLGNKTEILHAILNPELNLISKAKRIIQPNATGVAFEISKSPTIDWLEQTKRNFL